MEEVWRDIRDYEGLYQVSNLGNVRSLTKETTRIYKNGKVITYKRKGKNLKLPLDTSGYPRIALYKEKKSTYVFVHRLVAQTFLENEDPSLYIQVNHKDGVKTNNRVDNLEWCTRSENLQHAHDIGLKKSPVGEKHGRCKLNESDVIKIRELLNQGVSGEKLAKIYKVSRMQISRIRNKKRWKHID